MFCQCRYRSSRLFGCWRLPSWDGSLCFELAHRGYAQEHGRYIPLADIRPSQIRELRTSSLLLSDYLPPRILIALPAIPVNETTEMAAWSNINILARRVSGGVSVGLNARLVVNAMNR